MMTNVIRTLRNFIQVDIYLIAALIGLFILNIFVQFSANDKIFTKIINDLIYLCISFTTLMLVANMNLEWIKRLAIPIYIISIFLLILVLPFGTTIHGAKRWLSLGIRIQPSEICKLSVPLILAYYYSNKETLLTYQNYLVGFIFILIPFLFIAKQPDLGTAILVFASGFFVLFFVGLPWKIITSTLILLVCSMPLIWHLLHDYQKQRILTLLNPQSDPLGAGYHIIQGMIAIGSGGLFGQGYLHGTQVHLDFIPEKHTDFVITVLAEELGFIGVCVLLAIYLTLIMRSMKIVTQTEDKFGKLLGLSITLSFTLYILINMGMVSGIFPVVGVPLPFISYGGTAMIVLAIGFGIILAIAKKNSYT